MICFAAVSFLSVCRSCRNKSQGICLWSWALGTKCLHMRTHKNGDKREQKTSQQSVIITSSDSVCLLTTDCCIFLRACRSVVVLLGESCGQRLPCKHADGGHTPFCFSIAPALCRAYSRPAAHGSHPQRSLSGTEHKQGEFGKNVWRQDAGGVRSSPKYRLSYTAERPPCLEVCSKSGAGIAESYLPTNVATVPEDNGHRVFVIE